jgi:hypothetical protein
MKRSDVKVGKTYAVKVSGKIQPVTITHTKRTTAYGTYASASIYGSRYGRPVSMNKFMGRNEWTGRIIGPFTAAKCRFEGFQPDPDAPGRWVQVNPS